MRTQTVTTVRSVQERQACPPILEPPPWVLSGHARALILWRNSSRRRAGAAAHCHASGAIRAPVSPLSIMATGVEPTSISLTLALQFRRRSSTPSSRQLWYGMADSAAGRVPCFRRNGNSRTGRRSKVLRAIHVREIRKRLACETKVRQRHHCNPAVRSWPDHPHGGCNDGSECWSQDGNCFGTRDGGEWGHRPTNQRTAR